jgi:ArsR family transcriptional regulator, arsenate/arsenite/antimonite-responsive transcriptional repressor
LRVPAPAVIRPESFHVKWVGLFFIFIAKMRKRLTLDSVRGVLKRIDYSRIFAYIRLGEYMKTRILKPDRLFRALSDSTRLRILNLLLTGELCVCDIVSVLRVPQPTASRHLAYLRKVGLVTVRKDGVWCHYQLSPANTEFEVALQKCVECCQALPRLENDLQRLQSTRRSCCD